MKKRMSAILAIVLLLVMMSPVNAFAGQVSKSGFTRGLTETEAAGEVKLITMSDLYQELQY